MKKLLLICMFIFCSSNAFSLTDELRPSKNFAIVDVPAEVSFSERLETTKVWTLDCGVESDVMIGKLVSAAPGNNGRTILVDSQLTHLLFVGPNGQVENTIGQKGDGPGELSGAHRAFQLSGGRIGVCCAYGMFVFGYGGNGDITLLKENGDPSDTWPGAGDIGSAMVCSLREMRCIGNNTLTVSSRSLFKEGEFEHIWELSLLENTQGKHTAIARQTCVENINSSVVNELSIFEPYAEGRCDVSADGRVAFATDRNKWTVAIREPDGSGIVLQRPWDLVPRTLEQRQAVLKLLGGKDINTVQKTMPAVGRIRWRPNGKLWVEPNGVKPDAGAFACFDEFGPSGQFLRRVQLVVPGKPEVDELVLMENGQMVLLRGFKQVEGTEHDESVAVEAVLLDINTEDTVN